MNREMSESPAFGVALSLQEIRSVLVIPSVCAVLWALPLIWKRRSRG